MAFHVRDPETDRVVRELAARKGTTLTEAVREACRAQIKTMTRPERPHAGLRERLKPLLDEMAKYEPTGLEADKAFYDSLNDEED